MRRSTIAGLLAALVALPLTSASGIAHSQGPANVVPLQAAQRPNMVLILMDDFSTELLRTMPKALRLKQEGAFYRNAFVVDSLCCPSRSALLTGQLPHQTGVLTNTPRSRSHPIGGYDAFVANGNAKRTFNLALQRGGYTTGFVGKFLNMYDAHVVDGRLRPPPRVPGWTVWNAILGGGYSEWGFRSTWLDRDGKVRIQDHPKPPASASDARKDEQYATQVAGDKAVAFLDGHRGDAKPFFLEIATYGPHASIRPAYRGDPAFPPAFRDRPTSGRGGNCGAVACSRLTLHDLVGYDDPRGDNRPTYLLKGGGTRTAPAWRTNRITMTAGQALEKYRNRARMVQSIDRLIARVRRHVEPDTYIVLTSDNGFHLGQHQLNGGKGTPYDSDTRVPLVVVGPGVVPGARDQVVNNIDLAPTFEALAGLTSPSYRSGTSFAASLRAPNATGDRFAFFEHTWSQSQPGEVDTDRQSGGTIDVIPSYVAVRGARGLLVRVDLDYSWRGHRYAWELYRYDRPWEDVNVFASDHDKPYARELRRRLLAFTGCAPAACRAAAHD
jgi:arylsulfatase A-like enzyme